MAYKNDYKKIKEYAKQLKDKYNFKGLLHFTDFSNLEDILKGGYLRSRSECERRGIKFKDGANHEVLDKADEYVHNCVRFYYRGSTPTLYKNEGIKLSKYCDSVHVPIPVYLLFDKELLYLDNTYFTNGNATNSDIGNNYDFFSNMDWDTIFHNKAFDACERDYIINKRQAELLSEDAVPLKYLKKIIFRCEADRKRAINLFGDDRRYKVDISLFSNKNFSSAKYEEDENNFINNYSIEFSYDENGNKKGVKISLDFQKNWKEYEKSIVIKDINNQEIEVPKINVRYKDFWGLEVEKSKYNDERIILELKGNVENWSKIEIYVNNILCIEEFLLKDIIEEYRIYNDVDGNLVIHRKFRSLDFKNYKHNIKIFNSENEVVYTTNTSFESDSNALSWSLTLKSYNEKWDRVNYYINDILCISKYIE